MQDLEDRYAALKGSKPTDEPSILPLLKAHLKLERAAGTQILPGKRDEGRSASFCKAEKGMLSQHRASWYSRLILSSVQRFGCNGAGCKG